MLSLFSANYGHIPGGRDELIKLMYPYHNNFPLKIFSKYRWHQNSKLKQKITKLNSLEYWLTIIDRLGGYGDTLITANVIFEIKKKYPDLKINCITPNPELLSYEKCIDKINGKESFYSFDSSYIEIVQRKEKSKNIVHHILEKIGINDGVYKARFFLDKSEIELGAKIVSKFNKPIIAFSTKSNEEVKNWPVEYWKKFISMISSRFTVLQLGDKKEPNIEGAIRFSGKLTIRESASILMNAFIYIGPDSLLMHLSNAFNIKCLIIWGGSRPVSSIGYPDNVHLSTFLPCSPCWIHSTNNELCEHQIQCMKEILPNLVLAKFYEFLK